MADINKGDQVQLKSGGPIMTVQDIGDYSMNSGIENGALCIWFDGNKPMQQVFDLAVLELFEE